MRTQLLEIQPSELKFIFESKKQSSCSVQLVNNSADCVAFKVKTTSPKKYSVRPNVGLVLPYSTCEFVVTMQAQRTAPTDMLCKDKFLVQSTSVPAWTVEADISSSTFSNDAGKYVEEKRLSVILISPANSLMLSPINAALKEAVRGQSGGLKEMDYGTSEVKHQLQSEADIMDAQKAVVDESTAIMEEDSKPEKETETIVKESTAVNEDDSKPVKVIEMIVEESTSINEDESKSAKATEKVLEECAARKEDNLTPSQVNERVADEFLEECAVHKEDNLTPSQVNERVADEFSGINKKEMKPEWTEFELEKELTAITDVKKFKLVQDIEEMKSNLMELELKLSKAEDAISKLAEGRLISSREIEVIQKRLAELSKNGVRRVTIGFPLVYVCLVAVISIILGSLLHR